MTGCCRVCQRRIFAALAPVGKTTEGMRIKTWVIKVNGKTSGFEPGDESEHLIPPYTQNCVFVICTWSTVVI